MTSTSTYDAEGNLTELTETPLRYTISYARKVPRDGGYGAGEEASVFAQLDIASDDTPESIEAKLKNGFAFIKAVTLQQLGVTYGVDQETGVVNGLDSAAASAAAAPAARATTPSQSHGGNVTPAKRDYGDGVKRSKEELIAELQSNPGQFFDNRVDKKNPKGPDFKRKSSGEGLWLSDLESAGVSV